MGLKAVANPAAGGQPGSFTTLTVTGAATIGGGLAVTGSISATGQIVSQDSLRVAKAGSDTFGSGPYMNLSNVAGTVGIVQQLNAAGGLNWYNAAAASSPIMTLKTTGVLNVPNMPTSSAGLVAGDLWSDGGTIKIV